MRVRERQRVIERVRRGRSGLRMWWPMATRERGRDERCDKSERVAESLGRERVKRGLVFCLRECSLPKRRRSHIDKKKNFKLKKKGV